MGLGLPEALGRITNSQGVHVPNVEGQKLETTAMGDDKKGRGGFEDQTTKTIKEEQFQPTRSRRSIEPLELKEDSEIARGLN